MLGFVMQRMECSNVSVVVDDECSQVKTWF